MKSSAIGAAILSFIFGIVLGHEIAVWNTVSVDILPILLLSAVIAYAVNTYVLVVVMKTLGAGRHSFGLLFWWCGVGIITGLNTIGLLGFLAFFIPSGGSAAMSLPFDLLLPLAIVLLPLQFLYLLLEAVGAGIQAIRAKEVGLWKLTLCLLLLSFATLAPVVEPIVTMPPFELPMM